jgi:hypothetical protein
VFVAAFATADALLVWKAAREPPSDGCRPRVISRTVAYAIITGMLAGIYAGLVLLATQVFGLHGDYRGLAAGRGRDLHHNLPGVRPSAHLPHSGLSR